MMKTLFFCKIPALSVLFIGLNFFYPLVESGQSQGLTPDQIEKISAQLQAIKKAMEEKTSSRNSGAAGVFLAASQSGKEALALYVKCYKDVNFDREGLKDSDFREWRDRQSDHFRDDSFIAGLQVQLRYLGLSCKAAESEELSEVFGSLMTYVDSLTQLDEMPGREMLQPVNSSIFARAYELDQQLAKNKSWEAVPYNIAGIYEKTILPYLRKENPGQLANAWDKRIEQQMRVVQFLEKEMEKQQKGSRDDKREVRNRQNRNQEGNGGKVLKAHDKDDFIRETLPALRWGKLVDMYKYGNRPRAALDMLAFIKENIDKPKAETWVNQLVGLLNSGNTPSNTPVVPVPQPTTGTGSAPPAPTSTGKPVKSGSVPFGLEP